MDNFQTEAVYDLYYQRDGNVQVTLAQNHIRTFDRFIDNIPKIFASENFSPYKFVVPPLDRFSSIYKRFEFEVTITNPRLRAPVINAGASAVAADYRKDLLHVDEVRVRYTPRKAFSEDETYGKNLIVDIKCSFRAILLNGDVKTHQTMEERNIDLGVIPIMVCSKECMLHGLTPQMLMRLGEDRVECGGYFVVMGMRKIVVAQEDHISNRVFVYNHTKTKKAQSDIRSQKTDDATVDGRSQRLQSEIWSRRDADVAVDAKARRLQSEIWSHREGDFSADTRIEISFSREGIINVNIKRTFNQHDIPFPIIFRAMGVLSDRDIIDYILCNIHEVVIRNKVSDIIFKSLISSVNVFDKYKTAHVIRTKKAALVYIHDQVFQSGRKPEGIPDDEKITDITMHLSQYLFPQCKTEKEKAFALGYAISRLLLAIHGYIEPDDRDTFRGKTVKFAGKLCEDLMYQCVESLFEKIQKTATDKMKTSSTVQGFLASKPLKEFIKADYVGKLFQSAIGSGDWKVKKTPYTAKGVTQRIDMSNYPSLRGFLHMMKVATKTDKVQHKAFGRHLFHQTLRMFVDPGDTPDGKDTGLVKRHTVFCESTLAFDAEEVLKLPMFSNGWIMPLKDASPSKVTGLTRVYINYILRGFTSKPTEVRHELIELRRKGHFSQPTLTVFDDTVNDNLHICTYDSRLAMPFVIVDERNKPRLTKAIMQRIIKKEMTWHDLLKQQIIEYITIDETLNCKIGYSVQEVLSSTDKVSYTHCLLHPSNVLGILMHTLPFPNSTQIPRNVFSCQYVKYTHGVPIDGVHQSFDYNIYTAYHVQAPAVLSRVSHLMGYADRPNGQMVTVAFMCLDGFNKEDAVIFSREASERGMLASVFQRLYKETIEDSADEFFPFAGKLIQVTQTERFAKINPNTGVPTRGTKLKNGDVIISKFAIDDSKGGLQYIDHSIEHREPTDSIVDESIIVSKRFRSVGPMVKVRLSEDRKLKVGDKVSPRPAQKGVSGSLRNIEDFPYTADGLRPDIVINPHAHPSRMLMSHPKEIYASAICERTGQEFIATPHSHDEIDLEKLLMEKLDQLGFNKCMKYFYHPLTGKKIKVPIFTGPCFYQRLPQIVLDKSHKRSVGGPITAVMRQPTAGRGNDGGLKLGEMERDALIAAGAARTLNEFSMVGSDKYTTYFCEKCGSMSWTVANPQKSMFVCRYCENSLIRRLEIPYVTKLTSQLLTASCVNMCLIPEQDSRPFFMND